MLLKRTLVVVLLLPIGLAVIYLGGWYYTVLVAIILLLAGYEFVALFRETGYQPSLWITLGAILLFVLGRTLTGFASSTWMLSLLILVSMAYHLFSFERGRDQAGTDFGMTLSSSLYIGWLGAYLISLREISDGLWWVLLVLSSVWLADMGAYMVGRLIGRHKMTPRLSPGKSWEGYLAGILVSTIGVTLLALLFQNLAAAGTEINPLRGAMLGFTISVLSILGDLGASMIKRQAGKKDSGTLLPGHGGAFDRIDSWLWAGVIGYYMISGIFSVV